MTLCDGKTKWETNNTVDRSARKGEKVAMRGVGGTLLLYARAISKRKWGPKCGARLCCRISTWPKRRRYKLPERDSITEKNGKSQS